jgi:hypothetical protein
LPTIPLETALDVVDRLNEGLLVMVTVALPVTPGNIAVIATGPPAVEAVNVPPKPTKEPLPLAVYFTDG